MLTVPFIDKRVKLTPVEGENGSYFDITVYINRANNAQIIDNPTEDYTDYVDCDTLVAYQLKIDIK